MNAQKLCEQELNKIKQDTKSKRILLHSCCAPCSTYVIEYLSDYLPVTVFYYNPNIFPHEEYTKRAKEQKEFLSRFPSRFPLDFLEGSYDTALFYQFAKNYAKEPEGGERCKFCYELRMRETAKLAKQRYFDYFATTLTISPLKQADLLNQIGVNLGKEYQVTYLPSDFKKKNGYLRSVELSKEYDLYRQNFCGCIYSMSKY